MRIGIGYDIHRLVKGRRLILGGIEIPHKKGLLGHSDADAVIHAVIDAVLGAAALGDIGGLFPDTDPKYKGIASSKLLLRVNKFVRSKGYHIGNIDIIVLAQEPKLTMFKKRMAANIARLLGIAPAQVNVKAKTNEGLGVIGKKEAIAAYAVALLEEKSLAR
ncbi:MAG: 2-C-methyl-D-erythritol 2,4-cyclodiphosphate synthase [Candidatus Omnitrophica bacterium]|nr:2-C-methyl-D-erythritol 2,4-cyclodiphosphate synthase [Candidatus Omnitrophota bacterium]